MARRALDLGLGTGGQVRFLTAAGPMSARPSPTGAGIELAFPQRDLHIRSGVLKVQTVDAKK